MSRIRRYFVKFGTMKKRLRYIALVGGLSLGFAFTSLPAANDEPILTTWMVENIKSLPYGLQNQETIVLRSKHIDHVEFFGAGRRSRTGFSKQGLASQSVWMELKNRGEDSWASAAIKLSPPLNVSRYNSMVIWVRANLVKQRLSVGLQDTNWTTVTDAQARTPALPQAGLQRNDIVQISIPLNRFESDRPINISKLNQITLEFGRGTTGNSKSGSIDVFGIAFVNQVPPLAQIEFVTATPPDVQEPAVKVAAKPIIKPKPAKKKTVQEFQMQVAANQPFVPAIGSVALNVGSSDISPRSRRRRAALAMATPSPVPMPTESAPSSRSGWLIFILVFLIVGSLVTMGLLMRRRAPNRSASLGKIISEIHWTLASSHTVPSLSDEKLFWKNMAAKGISTGWMSPFQATAEQLSTKEDYYAKEFLLRQIELASQTGIELFPSLCFARTVFQYETFLSNPRIYLFKHVAPSDRHYSDEELRTKNIGYFPVWIPPFWQRQHALPERVLVAYGKLPGVSPSSDSVQFHLTSPELRKYAIDVLCSFAEKSPGVRIQGAAAMLNSALLRFWRIPLTEQQRSKAGEFWAEVIRAVKEKYPTFLFIADSAGPDMKLLVDLGFDFFENNLLRETLVNQIRLEGIGNLPSMLTGLNVAYLDRSIHSLSSLINSSSNPSVNQRHHRLASLVLSLLPGTIEHNGVFGGALEKFLRMMQGSTMLKNENFLLLNSDSNSVLSFARWDQKTLFVSVVNLSSRSQTVNIHLNPFHSGFTLSTLYLFNDVLHGAPYLGDLPTESSGEPAVAVLGQDVQENGLPVTMTAHSLRLFSVNLRKSIPNEISSHVREFHQA